MELGYSVGADGLDAEVLGTGGSVVVAEAGTRWGALGTASPERVGVDEGDGVPGTRGGVREEASVGVPVAGVVLFAGVVGDVGDVGAEGVAAGATAGPSGCTGAGPSDVPDGHIAIVIAVAAMAAPAPAVAAARTRRRRAARRRMFWKVPGGGCEHRDTRTQQDGQFVVVLVSLPSSAGSIERDQRRPLQSRPQEFPGRV